MYVPYTERYAVMAYRRCGKSGLKLPEVSLGLWHNFGDTNTLEHIPAPSVSDSGLSWQADTSGYPNFRKDLPTYRIQPLC